MTPSHQRVNFIACGLFKAFHRYRNRSFGRNCACSPSAVCSQDMIEWCPGPPGPGAHGSPTAPVQLISTILCPERRMNVHVSGKFADSTPPIEAESGAFTVTTATQPWSGRHSGNRLPRSGSRAEPDWGNRGESTLPRGKFCPVGAASGGILAWDADARKGSCMGECLSVDDSWSDCCRHFAHSPPADSHPDHRGVWLPPLCNATADSLFRSEGAYSSKTPVTESATGTSDWPSFNFPWGLEVGLVHSLQEPASHGYRRAKAQSRGPLEERPLL